MFTIPSEVLSEQDNQLCRDFNQWVRHLRHKGFDNSDGKFEYYYKIIRRMNQNMVFLPPHCIFCFKGQLAYVNTGRHYWIEDSPFLAFHESCLLLSSASKEAIIKPDSMQGYLGGYSLTSIVEEFKRSSNEMCAYCSRVGAHLKCCGQRCKKTFHFVCGIRAGVHFDYKNLKSYCVAHSPNKKSAPTDLEEICTFCQMPVPKTRVPREVVETPCCGSHFYHFVCFVYVVKTLTAPLKCFFCSRDEKYTKFCANICMQSIFIPARIAGFEYDDNNNIQEEENAIQQLTIRRVVTPSKSPGSYKSMSDLGYSNKPVFKGELKFANRQVSINVLKTPVRVEELRKFTSTSAIRRPFDLSEIKGRLAPPATASTSQSFEFYVVNQKEMDASISTTDKLIESIDNSKAIESVKEADDNDEKEDCASIKVISENEKLSEGISETVNENDAPKVLAKEIGRHQTHIKRRLRTHSCRSVTESPTTSMGTRKSARIADASKAPSYREDGIISKRKKSCNLRVGRMSASSVSSAIGTSILHKYRIQSHDKATGSVETITLSSDESDTYKKTSAKMGVSFSFDESDKKKSDKIVHTVANEEVEATTNALPIASTSVSQSISLNSQEAYNTKAFYNFSSLGLQTLNESDLSLGILEDESTMESQILREPLKNARLEELPLSDMPGSSTSAKEDVISFRRLANREFELLSPFKRRKLNENSRVDSSGIEHVKTKIFGHLVASNETIYTSMELSENPKTMLNEADEDNGTPDDQELVRLDGETLFEI